MLALDPAARPTMADIDRLLTKPSPVPWLLIPAAVVVVGAVLLLALWPHPPVPRPAPTIEDVTRVDPVAYRSAWAEHLGLPIEFTSDEGVAFVLIPPGELPLTDELGERVLRLAKPTYFAQTELTVGQMRAVVAATGFVASVERRARDGEPVSYVFRAGEWSIVRGRSWQAAGLTGDSPTMIRRST